MTDKTAINAPAIAVLPLLLIWMAAILPFYHPNMGGGGLALPQNILAWSAMALTTLLVTFTVCLGRARLTDPYRTPVAARHRRIGAAAAVYPPRVARRRTVALRRFARWLAVLCRLPAAAPHHPATRSVAVRPAVRRKRSGIAGGAAAVRPRAGLGGPQRPPGLWRLPTAERAGQLYRHRAGFGALAAACPSPRRRGGGNSRCSPCWPLSPPCWC